MKKDVKRLDIYLGDLVFVSEDIYSLVTIYAPKYIPIKKDRMYILGEFVYLYRGEYEKKNSKDNLKPGIYKKGKDDYIIIEPTSKIDMNKFSISHVKSLTPGVIMEKLKENIDNFLSDEDVEMINTSGEIYVPTIEKDDDFLKVLIKRAIIEKKINIKSYRNKGERDYTLTNLKSILSGNTKMSPLKFLDWCDLLGLSFRMELFDTGEDKRNPMRKKLILDGETNEITEE